MPLDPQQRMPDWHQPLHTGVLDPDYDNVAPADVRSLSRRSGIDLICALNRCDGFERQVGVPYQLPSQQHADERIKCQAKTRPPPRYTGTIDEGVMDEVKNSVPNKGSGH